MMINTKHTPGPLVQLPSGRVVGGELTDRGTVIPHKWGCECDRCGPEKAAARERIRDAAPALLAALRDLLPLAECYVRDNKSHGDRLDDARDAIAKAEG